MVLKTDWPAPFLGNCIHLRAVSMLISLYESLPLLI